MSGGYLRTNWRQTQKSIDWTRIAGGIQNASLIASAGSPAAYPLVIMSLSGANAAAGVTGVGAYSMLSACFGSAIASNMGSGYKILPVGLTVRRCNTSASLEGIWFSICTSDDSNFNIGFYGWNSDTVSLCSASFHIQIAGFIVSTP